MKKFVTAKRLKMCGSVSGWGALLVLLLSCANPAPRLTFDPIKDEAPAEEAYLLGPTDVLEVLVWKNDSLSRTVTVRPDGYISLPLIGDVKAAGLSTLQLRDQITEKVSPYYKEVPEVSVIVQHANSSIVYILGEVRQPGSFPLKTGTTLLQGIALAGGFTPFASTNKILLIRDINGDGKKSTAQVQYKDLIPGHLDSTIMLRPGDTIFVP
jgi:polysaccharide export outer membrane protein